MRRRQSEAPCALEKATGCGFQLGEIFVDGGGEDGAGGVEAAVGESVAHPGNLRPWEIGFSGEKFIREHLHRFADLDEPYPYGVEDKPVFELTPL